MIESLSQLEGNILLWIQDNVRLDLLNPIIKFFTALSNHGELAILTMLLLICIPKTRKIGIICLCSLAATFIIGNLILKPVIDRIRPYEAVTGLVPLVKKLSDSSFPSAHTSSTFSVMIVVFREMPKKYGIPALITAVLMGLSRLYVGVHYPTDVLGGVILGTTTAIIACIIYEKKFKNKAAVQNKLNKQP